MSTPANEPDGIERFYAHALRIAAARTLPQLRKVWEEWAADCERRASKERAHRAWIQKNLAKSQPARSNTAA